MLIDAAHPEETRVAIIDGSKLNELDVESTARKQLKGNIYLAKVTRVEPSLQAAFVDFGGNRHGFLAFSEIHPDYYQIPIADRRQILEEDEKAAKESADESESGEDGDEDGDEDAGEEKAAASNGVETLGGDDMEEIEAGRRARGPVRKYRIQEVIKRRQILLIQVVKEERGNKGAAMTTYLSLAGRYCVLMPNTGRGGGISRKIANPKDRRRLKSVVQGLDVPPGMAVIVRTAGSNRGKAELTRDYKYLIKLWTNIRDMTMESVAPTLIHEEANLIIRALRDLYQPEVDEILVEGETGYRMAKDLMKTLIPSHAKKVQPYSDLNISLFHRYNVEDQLESMNSPTVQLKSGGYIVIDATEALVAIDVNSGRATRGRSIEETALKTNLEAASEIARQLRLRDLAGLIVIDFIDMDHSKNQISVERMLKDAMRIDRARIQIGRISPFGLLELSRQRLRPSLGETVSEACPYCDGTGIRRSIDSAALHVLRGIENESARHRNSEVTVAVASQVTLFILNNKRAMLAEIEEKFGMLINFTEDDTLIPPNFSVSRKKRDQSEGGEGTAPPMPEITPEEEAEAGAEGGEGEPKRKKRRRSRRRKRSDRPAGEDQAAEAAEGEASSPEPGANPSEAATPAGEAEASANNEEGEKKPSRRRRGRRGGRRRARRAEGTDGNPEAGQPGTGAEPGAEAAPEDGPAPEAPSEDGSQPEAAPEAEQEAAPPKRRRRVRKKTAPKDGAGTTPEAAAETPPETAPETSQPEMPAPMAAQPPEAQTSDPIPQAPPPISGGGGGEGDEGDDGDKPSRKGWWQRLVK